MSKLYGLFDIRGKRDGYKYYGMKGVNGTIQAKINEGMSSRVKNSPEYANTRLNNAEFGAAGNMAGAIAKALTQRWRSVTVPFATAKMLPGIKLAMDQDTTHPWGQRSLTGTDWQHNLRQMVNGISKVSYDEEIGISLSCSRVDSGNVEISIDGKVAQAEFLASKGITGFHLEIHPVKITAPVYDSNTNKYTVATVLEGSTRNESAEIDEQLSENTELSGTASFADASGVICGAIVVFKPFRQINNVEYVAQEFCCHKFVGFPALS